MSPISKIKNTSEMSKLIKRCYRAIRAWSIANVYNVSPELLAKLRFKVIRGVWPDLSNPETFDEKLLWLMLYWRHPLKTQCGDKYGFRSYVKEHGLEHILPELLGVYEDSNEIDFDALPERFVLKCTHGCGFNIVCKGKNDLNEKETKNKLDLWMKVDFSKVYGEVHYASMKPRIICECFMGDSIDALPNDYKVFCFNGKAHCTMACTDRGTSSDGRQAKYDIYDRDWKHKLPYSASSLLANRNIPKPGAYEEIIEASEKLAKPFPFVRMDFYSIKGRAKLGEMTFTPAGCIDNYVTELGQIELGKMIRLPEKLIIK